MPRRLLIIEQSPATIDAQLSAPKIGFSCERIRWSSDLDLAARVRQKNPDLLIVAASSANDEAARLVAAMHAAPITTPALAILAPDASDQLVDLASQVLDDFLFAPVRSTELRHRITRIIGEHDAALGEVDERLIGELAMAGLVGRDPAFLETISKIPLAARSNGPVLITGETGTGKELCARAIHTVGPRRGGAFVPVDCATIPEQLFESELFGHARGAFTDARSDYKGLVELANGGTLFLDEIDALSLSTQAKLLRLLQERSYRPLGFNRVVALNATIVAATNSDLAQMVKAGSFRADLFFRLNVLRLNLPPLRRRRDDIALLAHHFVTEACAEHGIGPKQLPLTTVRRLTHYPWPGNVRELHNVIQRAVLFSGPSDTLLLCHITDTQPDADEASASVHTNFREARMQAIETFEKRYVEKMMQDAKGNVSLAARLAHKERRAFGRLVKRYGVKKDIAAFARDY
jgi:DNA-binding NtrC family response regulator